MRRALQLGIGGAAALLVLLLTVVTVNTLRFTPRQIEVVPVERPDVDAEHIAELLARAIRTRTVAYSPDHLEEDELLLLHQVLEGSFPRVHASMKREKIGHSLLYRWEGRDPSLDPIVFMGHLDVVPTPSAEAWTWAPFAGVITDGFVWGRGALDNKQNVVGLLAAAEALIEREFQPKRTLLFSFGHDEEVGGSGAKAIAAKLKAEGVRPWMVLDEGGTISDGVIEGLPAPAALIGVAEKGYLTVELVAHAEGGHSSFPPKSTAVGRIARAVHRLEAHPVPGSLDGPSGLLFDYLGPHMSLGRRAAFANRWLLDGVLMKVLSAKPSTNATVRTTTAATVLRGGDKENVLPTRAEAVVNFRIRPLQTSTEVLEHIRRVIDDPEIEITQSRGGITSEASPVSPVDSAPFRTLATTIRQAFPGTLVAPYVTISATDARHFTSISEHVYRFTPMVLTPTDLPRIHGIDERISIEQLGQAVAYYMLLIENAAGDPS